MGPWESARQPMQLYIPDKSANSLFLQMNRGHSIVIICDFNYKNVFESPFEA